MSLFAPDKCSKMAAYAHTFTHCLFCLCIWQCFHLSSSSGPPLALSCCLPCSCGWGYDRSPSATRANMQAKNERNHGLCADCICVIVSYYEREMLTQGQLRPRPHFQPSAAFPPFLPMELPFYCSPHSHCMWAKLCISVKIAGNVWECITFAGTYCLLICIVTETAVAPFNNH